jgi:myo-inositol-1(or 4)-monophosphatase
MDLEKMLVEVTRNAGKILMEQAFEMGEITMKHADDPVTSLDRKVEENIKKEISEKMPANFIGEEYGVEDNGAEYTWIIDPIDGTKSMIAGEFNTSLSIAVEHDGKLVGGCVYDFMRDILYLGYDKNLKVYHGGQKVAHSRVPRQLPRIIIDGDDVKDFGMVRALEHQQGVKLIEKNGSIALAMAQVAAGVYDGMVYNTSKSWNVWDIAGGYYLLGCTGCVLNLDGEEIDYTIPQKGIIGMNHSGLFRHLPSTK